MKKEALIKELQTKATKLRRDSLFVMKEMGMGWLGGSFSSADIITTLLFHKMRHDPGNPQWDERDRLIISKAHCCEVYYSALAELGYFPREELKTYSKICSNLQVHVDCRTPGVDCSGGSLGLGLSFATGVAMGAYILAETANLSAGVRNQNARYRVYCILGDGECNEGEVWEAAANAAHYRLDNLTAIVDNNKFQSTGPVEEKMNIMPLAGIFKSFGWETIDIDGNDIPEVIDTFDWAESVRDKPQAIIAHTLKGKCFPELEGTNCHFVKITDELIQRGLDALNNKEE
jgi:transketolase